MAQLNLELLGAAHRSLAPAGTPRVTPAAPAAETRFQAALGRAENHFAGHVQTPLQVAELRKTQSVSSPPVATPTGAPAPIVQPNAPPPVAPAGEAAAADSKRRARETLELEAAKPEAASTADGDVILDGLQKLRGVFDRQESRLNAAMSGATDATSLIGLQVEVVNFSLLVEVASKLTGKSTSALESLMKGQ